MTGIGCIVLTGNEKAFAAGADMKEMQPKDFIEMFSSDFVAIRADGGQMPQADPSASAASRSGAAVN